MTKEVFKVITGAPRFYDSADDGIYFYSLAEAYEFLEEDEYIKGLDGPFVVKTILEDGETADGDENGDLDNQDNGPDDKSNAIHASIRDEHFQ